MIGYPSLRLGQVTAGPRPEWADACCSVCPAQTLGPGAFDVQPRPFHGQSFVDGMRIDGASGVPTCVHPFRVGLPPGAYASAGEPLPTLDEPAAQKGRKPIGGLDWPGVSREAFVPTAEQLALPEDTEDLEAWLIAMLRTAGHNEMASALEQAEAIAAERFSGEQIVTALRRVLAYELR